MAFEWLFDETEPNRDENETPVWFEDPKIALYKKDADEAPSIVPQRSITSSSKSGQELARVSNEDAVALDIRSLPGLSLSGFNNKGDGGEKTASGGRGDVYVPARQGDKVLPVVQSEKSAPAEMPALSRWGALAEGPQLSSIARTLSNSPLGDQIKAGQEYKLLSNPAGGDLAGGSLSGGSLLGVSLRDSIKQQVGDLFTSSPSSGSILGLSGIFRQEKADPASNPSARDGVSPKEGALPKDGGLSSFSQIYEGVLKSFAPNGRDERAPGPSIFERLAEKIPLPGSVAPEKVGGTNWQQLQGVFADASKEPAVRQLISDTTAAVSRYVERNPQLVDQVKTHLVDYISKVDGATLAQDLRTLAQSPPPAIEQMIRQNPNVQRIIEGTATSAARVLETNPRLIETTRTNLVDYISRTDTRSMAADLKTAFSPEVKQTFGSGMGTISRELLQSPTIQRFISPQGALSVDRQIDGAEKQTRIDGPAVVKDILGGSFRTAAQFVEQNPQLIDKARTSLIDYTSRANNTTLANDLRTFGQNAGAIVKDVTGNTTVEKLLVDAARNGANFVERNPQLVDRTRASIIDYAATADSRKIAGDIRGLSENRRLSDPGIQKALTAGLGAASKFVEANPQIIDRARATIIDYTSKTDSGKIAGDLRNAGTVTGAVVKDVTGSTTLQSWIGAVARTSSNYVERNPQIIEQARSTVIDYATTADAKKLAGDLRNFSLNAFSTPDNRGRSFTAESIDSRIRSFGAQITDNRNVPFVKDVLGNRSGVLSDGFGAVSKFIDSNPQLIDRARTTMIGYATRTDARSLANDVRIAGQIAGATAKELTGSTTLQTVLNDAARRGSGFVERNPQLVDKARSTVIDYATNADSRRIASDIRGLPANPTTQRVLNDSFGAVARFVEQNPQIIDKARGTIIDYTSRTDSSTIARDIRGTAQVAGSIARELTGSQTIARAFDDAGRAGARFVEQNPQAIDKARSTIVNYISKTDSRVIASDLRNAGNLTATAIADNRTGSLVKDVLGSQSQSAQRWLNDGLGAVSKFVDSNPQLIDKARTTFVGYATRTDARTLAADLRIAGQIAGQTAKEVTGSKTLQTVFNDAARAGAGFVERNPQLVDKARSTVIEYANADTRKIVSDIRGLAANPNTQRVLNDSFGAVARFVEQNPQIIDKARSTLIDYTSRADSRTIASDVRGVAQVAGSIARELTGSQTIARVLDDAARAGAGYVERNPQVVDKARSTIIDYVSKADSRVIASDIRVLSQSVTSSATKEIFTNPAVQRVLAEPSIQKLLAEPAVQKILADPSIRNALTLPAVQRALAEPAIQKALADPAIRKVLAEPTPAIQKFLNAEPRIQKILSDPIIQKALSEPIIQRVLSEPAIRKIINEPATQKILSELVLPPTRPQAQLTQQTTFDPRAFGQRDMRPDGLRADALRLNQPTRPGDNTSLAGRLNANRYDSNRIDRLDIQRSDSLVQVPLRATIQRSELLGLLDGKSRENRIVPSSLMDSTARQTSLALRIDGILSKTPASVSDQESPLQRASLKQTFAFLSDARPVAPSLRQAESYPASKVLVGFSLDSKPPAPHVSANNQGDLRTTYRSNDVRPEFRSELRSDLHSNLRSNLRSDLPINLRSDLQTSFRIDFRNDPRSDVRHDLRIDLRSSFMAQPETIRANPFAATNRLGHPHDFAPPRPHSTRIDLGTNQPLSVSNIRAESLPIAHPQDRRTVDPAASRRAIFDTQATQPAKTGRPILPASHSNADARPTGFEANLTPVKGAEPGITDGARGRGLPGSTSIDGRILTDGRDGRLIIDVKDASQRTGKVVRPLTEQPLEETRRPPGLGSGDFTAKRRPGRTVTGKRITSRKRYLPGVDLLIAGAFIAGGVARTRQQNIVDREAKAKDTDKSVDAKPVSPLAKKQPLIRPKHIVSRTDSLVELAERFFGDRRVGWLIAELNTGMVKQSWHDGRLVVELMERQEIELPVPQDLHEFRARKAALDPANLVTIVREGRVSTDILNAYLGNVV